MEGESSPSVNSRHVTFRTKSQPLVVGPHSFPELGSFMNESSFMVKFTECLKLAFCIFVVQSFTLKNRLSTCQLRLRLLVLRFRLRREVESHRKTLAEYVRYRQVFQGVSGDSEDAHNGDVRILPNARTERRGRTTSVANANALGRPRSPPVILLGHLRCRTCSLALLDCSRSPSKVVGITVPRLRIPPQGWEFAVRLIVFVPEPAAFIGAIPK